MCPKELFGSLCEFAPNPTDSCGSPKSDDFDQDFIIYHVWIDVYVELLAGLPRPLLLTFLEGHKGTTAPK